MSEIKWTSTFSVGIDNLDEHHKKLFDIINELHEAMISGKGQSVMKEVIEKLKSYTLFHFSEEEKILTKAGYSELDDQIKEHKVFIDKINSIEQKIINGQMAAVSVETSIFLTKWLQDHIKAKDKKYTSSILKK